MLGALIAAFLAGLALLIWLPTSGRIKRPTDKRKKGRDLRPGWAGIAGAAIGFAIFDDVIGGLIGAVTVVAVFVVVGQGETKAEKRRQEQLREQLPATLELLASCLSAGAPISQAMSEVAEVSPSATAELLRSYRRNLDVGRSQGQSWRFIATEPVWEPVANDIAALVSSGSAVTKLLLSHAGDARAELASELESEAKTLSVKSVLPLMSCFLPSFILVGVVPIIAGVISSGLL